MASKSDTPLSGIDTSRATNALRTPQWWEGSPVVAFDFETRADGRPFMLAISDGIEPGGRERTIEPRDGRDTLKPSRIVRHLANQRYSRATCVWFNLGFDAEVFAGLLPYENVEELRFEGETEWTRESGVTVTITYLKGKLLRFADEHGHVVTHYDIGNVVRGSLDGTAEEWLGESKADDVDAARFSEPGFIEANYRDIREYAKRDADLTRRLARAVLTKAERVGIPAGRPISTGYLAAEFLRDELEEKPGWGPNWMQSLAWDSYAGGRFEVYERGAVGEVAGPDINSAYPAVMAELPDPGTLAWERSARSLSAVREADYGFVDVTVSTDPDRRIQPFAVKMNGTVKYPALESKRVTVVREIFLHAVDAGLVTDFEIHDAALGHETAVTRYPFGFFENLYRERKDLEADGKDLAGLMLKIVLNSMYGKTAQTTLKRSIITDAVTPAEVEDRGEFVSFRSIEGVPIEERQEAGSLFNPFIATYITGLTRLELHRATLDAGLEDDTVMLATDCLMVDADAYERSDFDTLLGDTLGEWDFDYRGEAFVVGSGVYEVDRTDLDEPATKTATRGFREADLDDGLRAEAERAARDGRDIEVANERPVTLGEAMARGSAHSLADIGRFLSEDDTARDLSADFDSKRDWSREADYADLLREAEYGPPLICSRDGERARPPHATE